MAIVKLLVFFLRVLEIFSKVLMDMAELLEQCLSGGFTESAESKAVNVYRGWILWQAKKGVSFVEVLSVLLYRNSANGSNSAQSSC